MEIKTTRLALREFVAADWRAVLAYQSDARYLRFNEWEARSESDVRAFIQRFIDWQAEQPRRKFQLAIDCAGRLIGNCGVRIADPAMRQAELGYELDPNYWGNGYATEAAHAMLDFGFRELQLERVTAWCLAENVSSVRVLHKIGMKCEAVTHEQKWFKGRWWDALTFGISAQAYNG